MTADSGSIRLAEGLTREFLLHHRLCPKEKSPDGGIVVAVTSHSLLDALDEIACAYHCPISTETVSPRELERLIEHLSARTERSVEISAADYESAAMSADVRELASQPPVVRYVNLLIREAYDAGASDVHFEATRDGLSARLRIDGVLTPALEPPQELQHAIVSRVKLLAELDIAERRRPQDGRIRARLEDRELDLRVSTIPTLYGESVVLRLLDRGGRPVELEGLGLDGIAQAALESIARRPHGMLLVTGPTGSGKTTTLYACLMRRDVRQEKIVTVEDPIEYHLGGVTQVPVLRQAGVTFASALRSILRQDPDVIMIGEMRDSETAEIAVQAAMTGHLVFSTMHTNDAISAIPRLVDLGVPEYLVAATLEGVLAQRLVRQVCPACRDDYEPTASLVSLLADGPVGRVRLHRGRGCAECRGTGYRGRVGIFEFLIIDDAMKDAISRRGGRQELRELAKAHGLRTLRQDGWAKVRAGITTIDEVLRVSQT
jgi:general secretion pathway protein E